MSSIVRRILIVLVAVLVVVAGVLAYFRFFGPKTMPTGPAANTAPTGTLPSSSGLPSASTGTTASGAVTTDTLTLPAVKKASAEEALAQQLNIASRDFAERYGSYSSDGDFSNLEALLPVMTDGFAAETRTSISKSRATASTAGFVGVTTRALSATPTGPVSVESSVTVVVTAQRTTTGGANPGVTYEDLTLSLDYQDGIWKTDSAAWSKR